MLCRARTPTAAVRPAASPSCLPRGASTLRGARRAPWGQARAGQEDAEMVLSGMVFRPLQAAESQISLLDQLLDVQMPGPTTMAASSLARVDYCEKLEARVNEQINVELNMSYLYHALAAFMDRDNVGLPGFAAYFMHNSNEERGHANLLMAHQNQRGGKVKLATLLAPESEFSSEARGEALWSLELGLAMEKLNFGKLRELHAVAGAAEDAEWQQFIEHHLLDDQAADVKKAADLVSRARRAGPGHGVFHLDLELQREYGYGLAGGDGGAGAAA